MRINEIIEKGVSRPPPGQGDRRGGGGDRMMMNGGGPREQNNTMPPPGPGEITVDIMVPGNKCGLVIGKSGETIKQLQVCTCVYVCSYLMWCRGGIINLQWYYKGKFQDRSGCNMKMIQDTSSAGNNDKPLRVTGTPQKVFNLIDCKNNHQYITAC